jgi:hypothetical protein
MTNSREIIDTFDTDVSLQRVSPHDSKLFYYKRIKGRERKREEGREGERDLGVTWCM